MNKEQIVVFECTDIGLSGTTNTFCKKLDDGTYEARMGFALFGQTNMDEEEFKKAEYNPFHEDFYDNYHVGKGGTKDEAIQDMKKNIQKTHESMWI